MNSARRGVLRGAIHVHSTWSYDGQHSIVELAEFFSGRGMDFVFITEHSDTLTEAHAAQLVRDTAHHSSSRFLMIPGIEFSCRRRLHLLGLGVVQCIDSDDPLVVARHIRDQGGVCVVAHPLAYGTDYPAGMARAVDGLEVWNITKDGWLAPGRGPLALWRRWHTENPALRGFGALDLHSLDSPADLWLELDQVPLQSAALLSALRVGEFRSVGRYSSVEAGEPPAGLAWLRHTVASGAYLGVRALRNRMRNR